MQNTHPRNVNNPSTMPCEPEEQNPAAHNEKPGYNHKYQIKRKNNAFCANDSSHKPATTTGPPEIFPS